MIIIIILIALVSLVFVINLTAFIVTTEPDNKVSKICFAISPVITVLLGSSVGFCIGNNATVNLDRERYQERVEELDLQYQYLSSFDDYSEIQDKIESYNKRANEYINELKNKISLRKNPWTSWFICCFYTEKNVDVSLIHTFTTTTTYVK